MPEKWLQISRFENYEISDRGRVRNKVSRKILRPGSNKYQQVTLYKDGKRYPFSIHRLVLTAFKGQCPKGMEACHNNGDCNDNRLINLRWDSRSSNAKDRWNHASQDDYKKYAEYAAKLGIHEVERVFKLRRTGLTQCEIGNIVGCHRSTVSLILLGKTWQRRKTAKQDRSRHTAEAAAGQGRQG